MLLQASAHVLYQQVDAEGVLFSLPDEVYFGVNETAARVWQLLERAPTTAEDVVRRMADAYPDAPSDELASDVREVLEAFEANGLVERAGVVSIDTALTDVVPAGAAHTPLTASRA